MEELGSFGPTVVVAVGLVDDIIEQLQDACSARKIRLVTAGRTAELPISVKCNYAIVATLLPDGDGRKLASDFVRDGAGVLIVDNASPTAVTDVWSIGAALAEGTADAGDWLDRLSGEEHVEAVSRAGRLMEAQRLADTVEALAAFSGASGVPVSFVRMRAVNGVQDGLDAALDQLAGAAGVTTVFHDTPDGERMALVINSDRRRLQRQLDDLKSSEKVNIAVVEVTSYDNLPAVLGRSRLRHWGKSDADERPRVLIAVGPGSDKISETLRAALHRMDFTPIFWDAAFRFDDVRANPPVAAVVDARLSEKRAISIITSSLDQDPPIPVISVSSEDEASVIRDTLDSGAVDFLVWPFSAGEVQAVVARAVTIGSGALLHAKDRKAPIAASTVAPAIPMQIDVESEVLEIDNDADDDTPPPIVAEPDDAHTSQTETPVLEEVPRESIAPIAELTTEEPARSIEAILAEVVGKRLVEGDPVALEGLGVLSVRHETSRIVHDQAGRTIVEPPKRTLTFEPSRPDTKQESAD